MGMARIKYIPVFSFVLAENSAAIISSRHGYRTAGCRHEICNWLQWHGVFVCLFVCWGLWCVETEVIWYDLNDTSRDVIRAAPGKVPPGDSHPCFCYPSSMLLRSTQWYSVSECKCKSQVREFHRPIVKAGSYSAATCSIDAQFYRLSQCRSLMKWCR